MASLPIEQRILHYFLAMGAHQTSNDTNESSLSFMLGNDKLIVSILTTNDILERNKILTTLLRLTSLRYAAAQLYVAAPKLLGATLDAQIFRSHGIGLLLFDERRIEETIRPQTTSPITQHQTLATTPEPNLLLELATLKSMYTDMEKTLEKICAEFNSLKQNPTSPYLERPSTDFATASVQPQPSPFAAGQTNNSLPSFFANNPWLEVLSKRGRPEVTHLAG